MIWVITTTTDDAYTHQRSTKTWGYFLTEQLARVAIQYNFGSMDEAFYTHLVLESYEPGIGLIRDIERWFEWQDGKWIEIITKPLWAMGIVNWAMG